MSKEFQCGHNSDSNPKGTFSLQMKTIPCLRVGKTNFNFFFLNNVNALTSCFDVRIIGVYIVLQINL